MLIAQATRETLVMEAGSPVRLLVNAGGRSDSAQ